MGGYIGAKTGTLVASASDIRGDISATDTTPEIVLKNTTETDADGSRDGKITFKGEQSGGEESTLAQIQSSHDGTSDDEKGDLIFKTNDGSDGSSPTEAMRITSQQRVGIGTTTSLSDILTVDDTNPKISMRDSGTERAFFEVDSSDNFVINNKSSSAMILKTGDTERARIDSSGRILVGKTSTAFATEGIEIQEDAELITTKNGTSGYFHRITTDGAIIEFWKDSSKVGTIGTDGGQSYIHGVNGQTGIYFGSGNIYPYRSTGFIDNTTDLAHTGTRFNDAFIANGVTTTSDEREKQQIALLTDKEITAAKAISKLFKTYKWNDAVEEKGDNARTHTGVIAQEVEKAMSDAGLDAGDYGFFMSDTWWETQTEVAAVDANEEKGIEAQDAYTRTNLHTKKDEAPEGATERNRKGIRYPELLAFIGAATEQRLTNIETRLEALEAG